MYSIKLMLGAGEAVLLRGDPGCSLHWLGGSVWSVIRFDFCCRDHKPYRRDLNIHGYGVCKAVRLCEIYTFESSSEDSGESYILFFCGCTYLHDLPM